MLGRGEHEGPEGDGGATTGEPIDALRERLERNEAVHYRLDGTAPLVHQRDGGKGPLPGPDATSARAALTDRQLYFVAMGRSGTDVVEVPYSDVRSVEASSGLLGSKLAVRVWNRGTYRLSVGRGADVSGVATFLERASGTTQRVLAALEDAREYVTALGKRIEDGDAAGIREAHEAVREQFSLARTRIEDGPDELANALETQVADVATELQRTRLRAHAARAATLVERGDRLTDREDWDAAVAAYTCAADHLETAHDVTTAQDFGLAESIEREGERLEERVETLAELPLQLAEDARAAAQGADDLEQAVPAWAAALEHYRAAATAGWGTSVEFTGETDALRMQVEWAAANLIEARRDLAERLRREGDDHRLAGEDDDARDRYEAALSQLSAADRVASELRAGDADAIDAQRADLRERLLAVRPTEDAGDPDGASGPSDGPTASVRNSTAAS